MTFAKLESVALIAMLSGSLFAAPAAAADYRSPFGVSYSPDGRLLAVSDRTGGAVAIIDAQANKVRHRIALRGMPTDLLWGGAEASIFVSETGAGTVAQIDPKTGKVVRRLAVGPRPVGLGITPDGRRLVVANSGTHTVSILDLATGKESARIRVPREPYFVTVTPDGATALVGNLLPAGPSTDSTTAAVVSLIDLKRGTHRGDLRLPPGSTVVRGIVTSPDGRWAYALHSVGRFNVPTTQIERGWVNTNAFSVLDLEARKVYATLLLDNLAEGAADPWDVVVSKDGAMLWISLSGVHGIAKVDLARLHELLEGKLETVPWLAKTGPYAPGSQSIWQEIKEDANKRALLVNDLAALYAAKLITRTPVPGKGPRGLSLAPDGKRLAVAVYFAGHVALLDPETGKAIASVSLGQSSTPDLARQGEIVFHDATVCFQHWMSCATCHPNDGRVDGLNWDLLNDGLGNPKNVKSLLLAHKTPPAMATGIRTDMDVAVLAGFRHILFREPGPEPVDAVRAYLRSLRPERSPYRQADGSLTPEARRGKTIFESEKARCARCHPGSILTDLKMHNVGTRGELDRTDRFDTPTLIEVWRTGPFLHDGSATTLHDVVTTRNKKNDHGDTSHLSKKELDALVAYLRSL